MSQSEFNARRSMPVLALRGLSVFPGMLLNFDVERPMSVAALNMAMGEDQVIFLTAQKDMTKDLPFLEDVYAVGTACRVRQLLRQPGGKSIRVMVEGIGRGRIASMATDVPCLYCEIDPEPDIPEKPSVRTEALCRRCVSLFGQYSEAVGNSPSESIITMAASGDPGYIADFAAQNVYLKPD